MLDVAGYRHDDVFDVDVPIACPGVATELLTPRNTSSDTEAYEREAAGLVDVQLQVVDVARSEPDRLLVDRLWAAGGERHQASQGECRSPSHVAAPL